MKQNGEIKKLNKFKKRLKLKQRLYFKWMQPFNAIQSNWKNNLKFPLRSSLGKVYFFIQYWKNQVERTLLHYKFFTQ